MDHELEPGLERHEERDALRERFRQELYGAPRAQVIERLGEALKLLGPGKVRFRTEEAAIGEEIQTVVEELERACQDPSSDTLRVWDLTRRLFKEGDADHLWIRGVVTMIGPPAVKQEFRAITTVLWEEMAHWHTNE